MWKQIAVSSLLWMGCTTAWAEELRKIYVAEPRGLGLDQGTLQAVSDQIRQGANDILGSDDYDVMTRENMIMYLRENNKDCSDLDTDCHIKLGGAVDAQYIVHGNVTKTGDGVFVATIKLYTVSNGRMLAMTTVRSDKESELLTLMRTHSQTLFKTGLNLSGTAQQTTGTSSEQIMVLRSSSDFAPSDELERMIWEEQRRQELEQQFAQIRREATEQRQKEATVMWQRIQPLLSSPSRQKLLNKFIEQYEQSKVVVEYISPDTGETTQSALTVPIPETFEARQLLFANRSMYTAKLIPAGSFLMGCTEEQGTDCDDDEQPMHTVTLSKDFYMMESEVTQELYQRVMGNNPSEFKGDNRPVEKVNWFDAVKFANKLSSMEGLEQCYTISGDSVIWSNKECTGWRLPTESEWEYSARGGESYKYAGSNGAGDVAWYSSNSDSQTHDVCGKKRNGYGLCDMSGNVWEWVWDWHGSYSASSTVDPKGLTNGTLFSVLRGGSWRANNQSVRNANRDRYKRSSGSSSLGFRLVRFSVNSEPEDPQVSQKQGDSFHSSKKVVTSQDLLNLAKDHLLAGREEAAEAVLNRLLTEFPRTELDPEVYYRLAEAAFNNKQYVESARRFQEVLNRYPASPFASWSLLRQGECFEAMGQSENAAIFYNAVIAEYPQSKPAKEARQKLQY